MWQQQQHGKYCYPSVSELSVELFGIPEVLTLSLWELIKRQSAARNSRISNSTRRRRPGGHFTCGQQPLKIIWPQTSTSWLPWRHVLEHKRWAFPSVSWLRGPSRSSPKISNKQTPALWPGSVLKISTETSHWGDLVLHFERTVRWCLEWNLLYI